MRTCSGFLVVLLCLTTSAPAQAGPSASELKQAALTYFARVEEQLAELALDEKEADKVVRLAVMRTLRDLLREGRMLWVLRGKAARSAAIDDTLSAWNSKRKAANNALNIAGAYETTDKEAKAAEALETVVAEYLTACRDARLSLENSDASAQTTAPAPDEPDEPEPAKQAGSVQLYESPNGFRFLVPAGWKRVPDAIFQLYGDAIKKLAKTDLPTYEAAFERADTDSHMRYPYILVQWRPSKDPEALWQSVLKSIRTDPTAKDSFGTFADHISGLEYDKPHVDQTRKVVLFRSRMQVKDKGLVESVSAVHFGARGAVKIELYAKAKDYTACHAHFVTLLESLTFGPAGANDTPVDSRRMQLAREFVVVKGFREATWGEIRLRIENDPDLTKEQVVQLMDKAAKRMPALMDQFAELLGGLFTASELEELIRFHKSPVAKKWLQREGQLGDEFVKLLKTWGERLWDDATK